MNARRETNLRVIIRGSLQVTLAMLAAASCTGWLLIGFLQGNTAGVWTLPVALIALTVIYSLLGFALGALMGRRQGTRGLVSATLGTLLTWAILEFFFHLAQINLPELRAPLIFGVPMCVLGGVLGMTRPADREAMRRELREELEELEELEGDMAALADDRAGDAQSRKPDQ